MKIGPKYKIAKRLGPSVFEKTQTQKFALAQERRAKVRGRGRGPTEYGKQLLEKQKVRVTYGLSERQFSNYVAVAMGSHAASHGTTPTELLHRQLELRLDNVAYRMGLTSTRRAARQLASHGHLTVNGVKTTVPSRAIRIGDKIAVRDGSKSSIMFEGFADRERQTPNWISFDAKSLSGEVTELPTTDSVGTAGDLAVVFSYYSR